VSRNALEGPLPAWLTSFVGLTSLDASFNNLSGPLPTELRVLAQLLNLSLSHNALSGSIPLEQTPPNLKSLCSLDLSFNSLNGSIPWGFASAYTLALNLSYNQLSGQLPGYASGALAANLLCTDQQHRPVRRSRLLGPALSQAIHWCPSRHHPGVRPRRPSPGTGLGCPLLAPAGWGLGSRPLDMGCSWCSANFDPHLTTQLLVEATDNFSDQFILGRGGFGKCVQVSQCTVVGVIVLYVSM